MRSTAIALAILLILGSGVSQTKRRTRPPEAQTQSRAAEDQAGIQKLQERDIAASTSLDVDALVALWTDDGVLLAPHHALIIGQEALRKFYEQQRDAIGNAEIVGYEEQWQEVRIVGDYAYQWGQIQERTRAGQSTAEESTVVNAMRILKRDEGGHWSIYRAIYNEARESTSAGKQPAPAGER